MSNEQRIEQLERRCRWLFATLAAIIVVGGVAVFSGAAQNDGGKNLRVESLEIIDSAGKVRIRLGDNAPPGHNVAELKNGLFGLQVNDAAGSMRASVHDLAQLVLERDDGRAVIVANQKGATLQLNGRGGSPRMALDVRDDSCLVQLRDTNGKISWQEFTPRLVVERDATKTDPFK